MTYLVFRCICGRHLYAADSSKTRTCLCGRRIQLARVRVIAREEDARAAGESVRRLQLETGDLKDFRPASKRV